ncbi:hypothetical protein M404DRAFT_1003038 [Pisolithus tinctorius Marx 270]|uniref:Uncharacterized protein n=1 Tax=Pisolithus tinctorius Marx 270 TaxID=870435 RepID=A0A0C3JW18_PISTI|nr:hypothetical protein M404DRAFT_1003038 [Pisolithus tinctorius Marx 270]
MTLSSRLSLPFVEISKSRRPLLFLHSAGEPPVESTRDTIIDAVSKTLLTSSKAWKQYDAFVSFVHLNQLLCIIDARPISCRLRKTRKLFQAARLLLGLRVFEEASF